MTDLMNAAAIESLLGPIETAKGLPAATYTRQDFFEMERGSIFCKQWTGVAFEHEVSDPGDAVPVTVAGVPIVVLRDRDNVVRAYHNLCRHRGALVLTNPVKRRPSLRCPFHGWTYDLSGHLKATPYWDGQKTCRPSRLAQKQLALKAIRCSVWCDMVFVDLSGEAESFEDFVKPLDDLWAPYEADKFQLAHYADGDISTNWKLAVETAVDAYHGEFVHRELSALVDDAAHDPRYAKAREEMVRFWCQLREEDRRVIGSVHHGR